MVKEGALSIEKSSRSIRRETLLLECDVYNASISVFAVFASMGSREISLFDDKPCEGRGN
jgi:hypothetical protein